MARKFFFVCAAMLMLALAFHLGAGSAGAIGGNVVCSAAIEENGANFAVDSNGTLYYMGSSDAGDGPWYSIRTIPVSSKPVTLLVNVYPGISGEQFRLFTEDGTVYSWRGWQGDYTTSNVLGGAPTPALRESWGQVKSRYRSTPGMPVTPGADKR